MSLGEAQVRPTAMLFRNLSDDELDARREAWSPPAPHAPRGWTRLYVDHVQQADTGVDLDFLVGGSGSEVPREAH